MLWEILLDTGLHFVAYYKRSLDSNLFSFLLPEQGSSDDICQASLVRDSEEGGAKLPAVFISGRKISGRNMFVLSFLFNQILKKKENA